MSLMKNEQSRPSLTVRAQAGMTFVEVLVAVVIISIGLLALARLQGVGVYNNHISHLHSVASIYTENMANMMRANVAAVNANDYASGAAPATINYATVRTTSAPTIDCRPDITATTSFTGAATACTSAEQAQVDAFNWVSALWGALPSGTGLVVCNDSDSGAGDADPCTDGSTHTISVSWNEKDLESGAVVAKTFSTMFRP